MFRAIEFKTEYAGDVATDWVLIAPIGESFDKNQTWHAVKTLQPNPSVKSMMNDVAAARWDVVKPAYEAWKKGEDIPEDGTPLGAWPGINADQAAFLKSMRITTVEEVAAMTDSTIDRLPFPQKREIPKLAKAFLKGKTKAETAKRITSLEEENRAMREMLEEMASAAKPEVEAA